jgi:hypothetical protein
MLHFSPAALFVFAMFCALLLLALSSGSASFHIAEAIATVIIALGLFGLRLRGRACQSYRSATSGSTRAARRAGK